MHTTLTSTTVHPSPVEPSSALSFPGLTRLSRFLPHPSPFLLFSICLFLFLSPLISRALTEGDYTYTTNAVGQATITGFTKSYSGALSILNTLGGCPVTTIGDEAFSFCTGLTSVTIPAGVTSIGAYVFDGCSELSSVTIPGSVTAIGEGAFYKCSSLTSGAIPGSVTTIGDRAFYGCDHLTSVTIPAGVTSINAYAFYYCPALSSVTIPTNVTSIGDYAFAGCTALLSVTLPDSVTSIGYAAFCGCKGLTSVTIPVGVTSIAAYAFESCSGLISVTIPVGVTSIGYAAFSNCDRMPSVTLPDSVTSIGEYAFCDCYVLRSITIPGSVTNIGEYAFSFCTGLTGVLFQGNPPALSGSFIFYSIPATLCLCYLPDFASNWPTTFGGRPTHCWNPTVQKDAPFGFTKNRFDFNITGTANIPVAVEATTNLVSGVWTSLINTTLDTWGSLYFSDPSSTNIPSRYYRIVWP